MVLAAVVAAGAVGNVNDVTKFDKKEPAISNPAANVNDMAADILSGKTLYVAGDSIAYGNGSAGGYGKCIADQYGMTLTNEAVDGATLTPNVTDNVNRRHPSLHQHDGDKLHGAGKGRLHPAGGRRE